MAPPLRPPSVREGFGLLLVTWAVFSVGTLALSEGGEVSAIATVALEVGGILLPAVLWASLRGIALFPGGVGTGAVLVQGPLLGVAGPVLAFGLAGLLQFLRLPWGDELAEVEWPFSHPLWVQILLFALVPAVCEEFLFRGAFLSCLRTWPEAGACAASAATFALFHGSLSRFLPVAALGYALALLVRRTGSLSAAVAVHAGHNTVVLLLLAADITWIPPALAGAAAALGVFMFAFAELSWEKRRERDAGDKGQGTGDRGGSRE